MSTQRLIIVGAGIGGLAAALDLAAAGREVLVLEKAPGPGGKLRRIPVHGQPVDAGPTVFTMRWVFDELFEAAGSRLEDHLRLTPLQILARHGWNDGARLDLFADRERSADAIGRFAGGAASRGYRDFCARSESIYRTLEHSFLRSSRPSPSDLARRAGWRGLPDLVRIAPFRSMWAELGRYFSDHRLRQLFGRYATYCGSSPFDAPATLMLVAHVERQGVWAVDGGLHRLALVIAERARQHGATLRYKAAVHEIVVRDGRATGVRLADGEFIEAAAVLFNGDVAALTGGLLGQAAAGCAVATAPAQRSLSAITWAVRAVPAGWPLIRHNVFFSDDYPAEFDDLVRHQRVPRSPSVYVCAQDRGDDVTLSNDDSASSDRPVERFLCIVNAPATGDRSPLTPEEVRRCEERTFQQLARCGLILHRVPQGTVVTTPSDFESMFPATGGALYGPASQGWQATFRRPGSRSRLPGLYLAGGSTHPGPGVPMAALSGRQAATSMLTDLNDTRRFRPTPRSTDPSPPAAMRGGTSTH